MSLKDVKFIPITLASEEKKLEWIHGEIEKPETVQYRYYDPKTGTSRCSCCDSTHSKSDKLFE